MTREPIPLADLFALECGSWDVVTGIKNLKLEVPSFVGFQHQDELFDSDSTKPPTVVDTDEFDHSFRKNPTTHRSEATQVELF
jgi:hypothetical protein